MITETEFEAGEFSEEGEYDRVETSGTELSAADDGYGVRVLPDKAPTDSVDALRRRLAQAERVEAEQRARLEERRAARAAEVAAKHERRVQRASELTAALANIAEQEGDAHLTFPVRAAARRFLHGGAVVIALIGSVDAQLHALAEVNFEVTKLLDDADGDSEVAAQLDALERASWSALHARAVFVANPQGA